MEKIIIFMSIILYFFFPLFHSYRTNKLRNESTKLILKKLDLENLRKIELRKWNKNYS